VIDLIKSMSDAEKEHLADKLIECAMLDMMPALNGPTDLAFLINDDNRRFGALQWSIRNETVDRDGLIKAMGNQEALAEVVHREAAQYGRVVSRNAYAKAYPL
jgi:hypothetical protein